MQAVDQTAGKNEQIGKGGVEQIHAGPEAKHANQPQTDLGRFYRGDDRLIQFDAEPVAQGHFQR